MEIMLRMPNLFVSDSRTAWSVCGPKETGPLLARRSRCFSGIQAPSAFEKDGQRGLVLVGVHASTWTDQLSAVGSQGNMRNARSQANTARTTSSTAVII